MEPADRSPLGKPVCVCGVGRVARTRLLARVERVYDGGMTPAFSTHFPGELAGLMTERQFRDVIDEVNRLLADADALEYALRAAGVRAVRLVGECIPLRKLCCPSVFAQPSPCHLARFAHSTVFFSFSFSLSLSLSLVHFSDPVPSSNCHWLTRLLPTAV